MKDLFPFAKKRSSKKKAWLDYLFYNLGKQKYNYYLCGLRKTEEKDRISTKWFKYLEIVAPLNLNEHWRLNNINQRQVLSNEIVLDLEERENLSKIKTTLLERNQKFFVFDTHSRGYHINIFFKRKISKKRKEIIINYFQADLSKANPKTMIALEFSPHWKSGKIKELVYYHV